MRKKIKSAMLIGVIGFFLVCGLTACSSWKKMTSWLPFVGDEQSQHSLTDKDIKNFTHTIKATNSDAESHYRLACFYQERKKHQLAIEEFLKALQNDSAYVKAYNGLGVSYDLLGEFPSALKAYEAALRLNPNLAYIHNNIGYSYLLQKKFDLAIKAFQQAVSLDQENKQYHNNLALAFGKQGKYELAFDEFKRGDNEEKARRQMARLFNYTPKENPPAETFVAENIPQADNQNPDKEKPTQTALLDQGIVEEKFEATPSENLSPGKNKELVDTHRVVISQNIEVVDQASYAAEKTQTFVNNHPQTQNFPEELNGIEVSNGNGIRHFARNVGSFLTRRGFQVASLKDEPDFTVKRTTIYYCEGYLQDAYQVAKQIPQYQDMIKVAGFSNPNIKVRVVIGKDMASYYKGLFFNAGPLRSL